MSYKPDKNLINELSEIKEQLYFLSDTVNECLNFGTYLTGWLFETFSKSEHDLPIYTTFIHFLECLDSIANLSKISQTSGVKFALRGLFESSLIFKHLISIPKEKGVIAYQVTAARKKIAQRKLYDNNEEKGKEFIKRFKETIGEEPPKHDSKEANKYLIKYLERDDIKQVYQEWKQTKKRLKRVPDWYSLYNGPNNLKELARLYDDDITYEILYSELSTHLHGSNTTENITVIKDDENNPAAFPKKLRDPEKLQHYIRLTITIVISTYKMLFDEIYPKRKSRYLNWYRQYLKSRFEIINSKPLFSINYVE